MEIYWFVEMNICYRKVVIWKGKKKSYVEINIHNPEGSSYLECSWQLAWGLVLSEAAETTRLNVLFRQENSILPSLIPWDVLMQTFIYSKAKLFRYALFKLLPL